MHIRPNDSMIRKMQIVVLWRNLFTFFVKQKYCLPVFDYLSYFPLNGLWFSCEKFMGFLGLEITQLVRKGNYLSC